MAKKILIFGDLEAETLNPEIGKDALLLYSAALINLTKAYLSRLLSAASQWVWVSTATARPTTACTS